MTLPSANPLSTVNRVSPGSPVRAPASGASAERSFMDWMKSTQAVQRQGDAERGVADGQRPDRQRETERQQQTSRSRQQATDEAQRRRNDSNRLTEQRSAEAAASRRSNEQRAANDGARTTDSAEPTANRRKAGDAQHEASEEQASLPTAVAAPIPLTSAAPVSASANFSEAGSAMAGAARTDGSTDGGTDLKGSPGQDPLAGAADSDPRFAAKLQAQGEKAPPSEGGDAADASAPATSASNATSNAASTSSPTQASSPAETQAEVGTASTFLQRLAQLAEGKTAAGETAAGETGSAAGTETPSRSANESAASSGRTAGEPGAAQRAILEVQRAAMQAAAPSNTELGAPRAPAQQGLRASATTSPGAQITSAAMLARQSAAADATAAGKGASSLNSSVAIDGKDPAVADGERTSTFQSVSAMVGVDGPRDGSALAMAAQAPQAARTADVRPALPVPTAAIAIPVDHPEFAEALARQSASLAMQGQQRADIEVTPPEMGPIRIRIEMGAEGATIGFSAEQAATRQAIEASLATLRGLLADQGVRMADARIDTGSSAQTDSGRGWQSADNGAASAQQTGPPAGQGGASGGADGSSQQRAGESRGNSGMTQAGGAADRSPADSTVTNGRSTQSGGAATRRIDLYA